MELHILIMSARITVFGSNFYYLHEKTESPRFIVYITTKIVKFTIELSEMVKGIAFYEH